MQTQQPQISRPRYTAKDVDNIMVEALRFHYEERNYSVLYDRLFSYFSSYIPKFSSQNSHDNSAAPISGEEQHAKAELLEAISSVLQLEQFLLFFRQPYLKYFIISGVYTVTVGTSGMLRYLQQLLEALTSFSQEIELQYQRILGSIVSNSGTEEAKLLNDMHNRANLLIRIICFNIQEGVGVCLWKAGEVPQAFQTLQDLVKQELFYKLKFQRGEVQPAPYAASLRKSKKLFQFVEQLLPISDYSKYVGGEEAWYILGKIYSEYFVQIPYVPFQLGDLVSPSEVKDMEDLASSMPNAKWFKLSKQCLEKAMELNPCHWRSYFLMGTLYFYIGSFSKSLSCTVLALKLLEQHEVSSVVKFKQTRIRCFVIVLRSFQGLNKQSGSSLKGLDDSIRQLAKIFKSFESDSLGSDENESEEEDESSDIRVEDTPLSSTLSSNSKPRHYFVHYYQSLLLLLKSYLEHCSKHKSYQSSMDKCLQNVMRYIQFSKKSRLRPLQIACFAVPRCNRLRQNNKTAQLLTSLLQQKPSQDFDTRLAAFALRNDSHFATKSEADDDIFQLQQLPLFHDSAPQAQAKLMLGERIQELKDLFQAYHIHKQSTLHFTTNRATIHCQFDFLFSTGRFLYQSTMNNIQHAGITECLMSYLQAYSYFKQMKQSGHNFAFTSNYLYHLDTQSSIQEEILFRIAKLSCFVLGIKHLHQIFFYYEKLLLKSLKSSHHGNLRVYLKTFYHILRGVNERLGIEPVDQSPSFTSPISVKDKKEILEQTMGSDKVTRSDNAEARYELLYFAILYLYCLQTTQTGAADVRQDYLESLWVEVLKFSQQRQDIVALLGNGNKKSAEISFELQLECLVQLQKIRHDAVREKQLLMLMRRHNLLSEAQVYYFKQYETTKDPSDLLMSALLFAKQLQETAFSKNWSDLSEPHHDKAAQISTVANTVMQHRLAQAKQLAVKMLQTRRRPDPTLSIVSTILSVNQKHRL